MTWEQMFAAITRTERAAFTVDTEIVVDFLEA